MAFYDVVVEPDREDHIGRHGVTIEEVEEVVFGNPLIVRGRERRLLLIGQTEGGRYLSVIVAPLGRGAIALITARDANDSERRRFHSNRHR